MVIPNFTREYHFVLCVFCQMQLPTTRLARCENIEQLVGLGSQSQLCILTRAWYGEQNRVRLTGPCPGMRADVSWSPVTLESRTTHRRLFFIWYFVFLVS